MSQNNDIWFVYMLLCRDGSLYTGITNNLQKRILAHNSGKEGARYTKSRRPVKLVYSEQVESRSEASKLEYQIKKLSRAKKNLLITGSGQAGEMGSLGSVL